MIRLRITTGRTQVSVAFYTDDPDICPDIRPVVFAHGETLHDAFETAISMFKEMQDAAIEELRRWSLINFHPIPTEPVS